jgi:hypothetical protein
MARIEFDPHYVKLEVCYYLECEFEAMMCET